jgi:hypothetical protein
MTDQPENAAERSGDEGYQTLQGLLTGEDPEEPIYFAYRATLRTFGTIPNLDEVSQNLGLTPPTSTVATSCDTLHPGPTSTTCGSTSPQ